MDRDQALSSLSLLSKNQTSNEIDTSAIPDFIAAGNYFLQEPDPACIPLLLNCFSEKSDFGLYLFVEAVLNHFDNPTVARHLRTFLLHDDPSKRYWATKLAQSFPNPELLDGLIHVYEQGDTQAKFAALTTLSALTHEKIALLLEKAIEEEQNEDLLEIIYFLVDT